MSVEKETPLEEFKRLLRIWSDSQDTPPENPEIHLNRLSDLIEVEIMHFYRRDPDPYDDRPYTQIHTDFYYAQMLKCAIRCNALLQPSYITDTISPLTTAACRLFYNILPGQDPDLIFPERPELVQALFELCNSDDNTVRFYAYGLLGTALELTVIATNFRNLSDPLVVPSLNILHDFKNRTIQASTQVTEEPTERLFAQFARKSTENSLESCGDSAESQANTSKTFLAPLPVGSKRPASPNIITPEKRTRLQVSTSASNLSEHQSSIGPDETSNSSWAEISPYLFGTYELHPLTDNMRQRLMLQFLTPLAEYKELLSTFLEHQSLQLILHYLDVKLTKDIRLSFEGLKFLSGLLCHRRFAIEFVQNGGLQKLLQIPRPSVATAAVSMCLYYIACSKDAFERVCQLPKEMLTQLMKYVLWLLDSSHESAKCHATMFLAEVFNFRVMIDVFDSLDGLRKLFNTISTLEILRVDDESLYQRDEDVFASRQKVKHCCMALKCYFVMHLVISAVQVKRHQSRHNNNTFSSSLPSQPYRMADLTTEVVQDSMTVLSSSSLRLGWTAAEQFLKLNGFSSMLQIASMASEWDEYAYRGETVKYALEILSCLTSLFRLCLKLFDAVKLPDDVTTSGFNIVITLAEGEHLKDVEVQKAALSILNNCVHDKRQSNYINESAGNSKAKTSNKVIDDLMTKMYNGIRSNNGIQVLLSLIKSKPHNAEGDTLRTLACQVLLGLSNCNTIKQIISKMPIFSQGLLEAEIRNPPLQTDKKTQHLKFCNVATCLLDKIIGQNLHSRQLGGLSFDQLKKADIVARTRITWDEKELLQLIYQHLLSRGFNISANALLDEADLHQSTSNIFSSPFIHNPSNRQTPRVGSNEVSARQLSINVRDSVQRLESERPTSTSSAFSIASPSVSSPVFRSISPQFSKSTCKRKRPVEITHQKARTTVSNRGETTLDDIVTSYLQTQHSQCNRPIVICPPFSLLEPHKCPEPLYRRSASLNLTSRIMSRSVSAFPSYGGMEGVSFNRKLKHSRFKFKNISSLDDVNEDTCFSALTFSPCGDYIYLGTTTGEVEKFDCLSTLRNPKQKFSCDDSIIKQIELTRDCSRMLTSFSWSTLSVALWNIADDDCKKLHTFSDQMFGVFTNVNQDSVVCTNSEKAVVFDVRTGQEIVKLFDADYTNYYEMNCAYPSYHSDDIILNDGVLWDIKQPRVIHKFDKFNRHISGVFHPNCMEVVINTEVWDLRTFKLIQTVPSLDQCHVLFNNARDVIYCWQNEYCERSGSVNDTSFKTVDAVDYQPIATFNNRKQIQRLALSPCDQTVAVLESVGSNIDEIVTALKLYEVGAPRAPDDEDEEDNNTDNGEDDDDDDDDDDDLDDDVDGMLLDTLIDMEEDGYAHDESLSSDTDFSISSEDDSNEDDDDDEDSSSEDDSDDN